MCLINVAHEHLITQTGKKSKPALEKTTYEAEGQGPRKTNIHKKQTSKTKYITEATLEYRPPLNISRNFFQKKKSRGSFSRKYGSNVLLSNFIF